MTELYPSLRAAMLLPGVRDPNAAGRLHDALAHLDACEGKDVMRKVEHDALRSSINRSFYIAWVAMVREPFFYADRSRNLTGAERKLDNDVGLAPECHRARGMLNKVEKATHADGPMRDAMLFVLRAAAPLGERVMALKAKIGVVKAEKTPQQVERDANAMTCQICARPILANTGVIAQHGYQRPGDGTQTRSCPGARNYPFEASCERLRKEVDLQKDALAKLTLRISAATADQGDVVVSLGYKESGRYRIPIVALVTRETFEKVKAEHGNSFVRYGVPSYDAAKRAYLSRLHAKRDDIANYVDEQQRRIDGWKQTHERKHNRWVAL